MRKSISSVVVLLAAAILMVCPRASAKALLDMTLEELMNIQITPAGSLTSGSQRMSPSTVTTISRTDIARSGARSLNELLDIYVPNLQMIRHHWESRHLGLRGIINDREEKYLLVVNGRVMNERTHFGALSERDLSMFGDIHHIDVVRGPGSATYGAGAVSMIIDIVTDNARTFQGTEASGRIGAVEEFYTAQIKHGQKFGSDAGLFFYVGIDDFQGADQDDAPLVYGIDFTDFWGTPVAGGEPFGQPINDDGSSYRGRSRLKAHLEYTNGGLDLWARYTRGGQTFSFSQDNLAAAPYGWLDSWAIADYPHYASLHQPGYGYQQATVDLSYAKPITGSFKVTGTAGFGIVDYERASFDSATNPYWNLNHQEMQYTAGVRVNWDISADHQLALGLEGVHEQFGRRGWTAPGSQAVLAPYVQPPHNGASPEWSTTTYSVFGEHQWRINDAWTTFLSARVDKNTYTEYLRSPRMAVIFTPDDVNTFKLMLSRSLRMTFAEEMHWKWIHQHETSDPETLNSIELRWERQQTENLLLAANVFYHDLEVIAWDSGAYGVEFDAGTDLVGELQQGGVEIELQYRRHPWRLMLSHGFTRLFDFTQKGDSTNVITAEPFGYGNDLANWSNHITKVVAGYDIDEHWQLDGSARIYWGFPGAKDYADYVTDNDSPQSRAPGYDDPYGPSIFLGLGVAYQPFDHLKLRLDGHNLLGLVDDTWNKRLYGFNSFADYRAHAPAVSFTVSYQFAP